MTARYEDCEDCRGSGFTKDYDSLTDEERRIWENTGDFDIATIPDAFCNCRAGDEAYEAAKASGFNPLRDPL